MKKIKTISEIQDIETFKRRVSRLMEENAENDCVNWAGSKDLNGYGTIHFEWRAWSAHRIMYELTFGEIKPEEHGGKWWVLHKCDNPSCVNPAHLYIGDAKDNAMDMANRKRQRRGYRPLSESFGGERNPNKKYGTVFYEVNGEIKTLKEWSLKSGINHITLNRRFMGGWPPEDLFKPTNIYNRHYGKRNYFVYQRFSGEDEVDLYLREKASATRNSQGF